jgi:nitrilase
VLKWIEDAAAEQIGLLAFPETFLPGYPFWLEFTNGSAFGDAAQQAAYAAYLDAAVTADGPELGQSTEAVRGLGVFVCLASRFAPREAAPASWSRLRRR